MSELDDKLKRFENLQRFQKLSHTAGTDTSTEDALDTVSKHLWDIPEVAGMVAGGVGGALTPVPGGAMLGGGAGAAGGNLLKQYLQQKLGVSDKPISASEAGMAGATGLAAELGGKVLGKVPLAGLGGFKNLGEAGKAAIERLVTSGKQAASTISGSLSGAGAQAARRTIERPTQVLSGLENLDAKAAKAGTELSNRDSQMGEMIRKARGDFAMEHGSTPVNTGSIFADNADAIRRYQPNSTGKGMLSPDEWAELRKLGLEDLSTSQVGPEKVPGAVATQMERKPGVRILDPGIQTQLMERKVIPTEKVVTQPAVELSPARAAQDEVAYSPLNMEWSKSGPPQIIRPPAKGTELTGNVISHMPTKEAGELRGTADWLSRETGEANWRRADASAKPVKGSIGHFQNLYGQIKDKLHTLSPDLTKADSTYSNFIDDAKLINRLEEPGSRENFIKELYKGKKQATVDAAQRQLPTTFDDIADSAAAHAYESNGKLSALQVSPKQALRLGLGAAGIGGLAAGHPELAGLASVLAMATDPTLHKYGLAYGSKALGPVVRPALEQTLPAAAYEGMKLSPWSLLKKEKDNGKKDN